MDRVDEIVEVLETSEDATLLEDKAREVWRLAGSEENCKGLIETKGLIGGMMRVMGKDGEGYEEGRQWGR